MSANNQTLIKKHKDKYYVFDNINAESWSKINYIPLKWGVPYSTFESAYEAAEQVEREEPSEYGIVKDVLFKDGAKVIIK